MIQKRIDKDIVIINRIVTIVPEVKYILDNIDSSVHLGVCAFMPKKCALLRIGITQIITIIVITRREINFHHIVSLLLNNGTIKCLTNYSSSKPTFNVPELSKIYCNFDYPGISTIAHNLVPAGK